MKNILFLYRKKNTLLLKLCAQNMEGGSQSLAPNPTVDSGLRPSQNKALPTRAITFIFQEARAEFLQGWFTRNYLSWNQNEFFRKGKSKRRRDMIVSCESDK